MPHPLNNFKIQKYYQNEPKLNGDYSRNNLPKVKDGNICECNPNLGERGGRGTGVIYPLLVFP